MTVIAIAPRDRPGLQVLQPGVGDLVFFGDFPDCRRDRYKAVSRRADPILEHGHSGRIIPRVNRPAGDKHLRLVAVPPIIPCLRDETRPADFLNPLPGAGDLSREPGVLVTPKHPASVSRVGHAHRLDCRRGNELFLGPRIGHGYTLRMCSRRLAPCGTIFSSGSAGWGTS